MLEVLVLIGIEVLGVFASRMAAELTFLLVLTAECIPFYPSVKMLANVFLINRLESPLVSIPDLIFATWH